MVRTKKIYREHLLHGAYQLVVNDGFKHFHARNVAKQIQCSTQPIYREFENLKEFKDSLCVFIIQKVENFFKKHPIDDLDALSHTIAAYSKKYPKEFQRFFIEDNQCSEYLENYIRNHFEKVMKDSDYADMPQEKKDSTFKLFWYYTIGRLTLQTNQDMPQENCEHLLVSSK
ncbi:AcrR family transcriptional regulator [Enterococcus sp. PF1-24]|uniref:TetR/AcrR family transcriptional regulator n=1 Tax=unclassified Enterococcus TaxID=2608891 RepID=UPI002472EEC5|nr:MULTISPECIES: TetR/AcrR family transcriptional regulator [unclassified Enterococcus]MDH6364794.1 AcrR family transcriptional regulator [Enterococcus sp. PFB1-1]MDH6401861.1 AcrR family transcriptional regulator [Enterococcus sp. PF1-24]